MRAELLVRGGTLVTADEVRPADLAVAGGRVLAVLPAGAACEAETTLAAGGKHLLPGLVDCHVHFNEPGRAHWEGFATGTAAAAAGGVTTIMDMPLNSSPPTLDGVALRLKQDTVRDLALVDYALWGGLTGENLASLPELEAGGVVALKAFMCNSGLAEYPPVDDAALYEALLHTAATGTLVGLHAENECLTAHFGRREQDAARLGPDAWAHARPGFTEEEAVQRALLLARETGARVHFVHVSTPAAVRAVSRAKTEGVRATLETCPHYLSLTDDDLVRLGAIAKCAPPLRPAAVVDELWQAVLAGEIDCIASDHSPCSPDEKDKGRDNIWCAWGGIAGLQTMLPVLLTEGVARRNLPLTQLVRLTSGNPARLFGLAPGKGSLKEGSDADIAIVDLEQTWTLRAEQLKTRWPLSPFVGRTFRGLVETTIVRGQVVFRNGNVVGSPGSGRLLRP